MDKKENNKSRKARKIVGREVYHTEMYDPLEALGLGHMTPTNLPRDVKYGGSIFEEFKVDKTGKRTHTVRNTITKPRVKSTEFRPFTDDALFGLSGKQTRTPRKQNIDFGLDNFPATTKASRKQNVDFGLDGFGSQGDIFGINTKKKSNKSGMSDMFGFSPKKKSKGKNTFDLF